MEICNIAPQTCPRRTIRCVTSRTAMSKPSGGIRSYLAVRLWLANAGCCHCLYLQCWLFEVLLVQTVNLILYGVRTLVHKPPLKREGDQRSWWRDSPVKYIF